MAARTTRRHQPAQACSKVRKCTGERYATGTLLGNREHLRALHTDCDQLVVTGRGTESASDDREMVLAKLHVATIRCRGLSQAL